MQHPVLIIRLRNIIRLIKNGWLCICHGYAKSCGFDHGQIVVSISSAVRPILVSNFNKECALSIPAGITSTKKGSEQ